MTSELGSTLADVLRFLERLSEVGASYRLGKVRAGALLVEVAVPGERWEIEFFGDRPVEVERFRSSGVITSSQSLSELWGFFEE